MPSGPLPLFVYGTLRDARVRRQVLGSRIQAIRIGVAIAPHVEVVRLPLRPYPALLARDGASAPGLVLKGITRDGMAALDRFEGAEYRRDSITVFDRFGRAIACQTYWCVLPIAASAPRWRLEDWSRGHRRAIVEGRRAQATPRKRSGGGMGPLRPPSRRPG